MPIELFFIFGIFTLIFGYVAGNFFPVLKENPFAPAERKTTEVEFLESLEDLEDFLPATPVSHTAELLDVGHFWRTAEKKELVAQIDDKLIYQSEEISGDHHALLSMLLLDLGNWVGLERPMQVMESIQSQTEAESASEEETSKAKSPMFSPIDLLKKAVMADVYLPLADVSLADQIDPILQRLLSESPLDDRGISLMDIEGRGMVVNVGLDLYDSVEDVPDEDVKAMIRQAVSEWEQAAAGG